MYAVITLGLIFLFVNKILNQLQNRAIQKRKRKQIPPIQQARYPFKVISYNILAKNLMHQEPLPNKMQLTLQNTLYPDQNSSYKQEPDLICYQEVDSETHYQLQQSLQQRNYDCKSNINEDRKFGVMLAWKRSRYTFKKQAPVNLDDVVEQLDFQGIDQQKQQFNRGHVALIVQLEDNDTGLDILATTIHAFWDPKYEYVKYAEIAYICDLIQAMKKKQSVKGPIIIGGDLNSLPYSDVVRYLYKLERANLPNHKMQGAQIKKPQIVNKVIEKFASNRERITFRSAYDMYFQHSKQLGMENVGTWSRLLKVSHPQFTNWTMKFKDTLDYIFYTPQNCELVELKSLPRIEDMYKNQVAKLPNEEMRHGSDHLPIGAVFSYKFEVTKKRNQFSENEIKEFVENNEVSSQGVSEQSVLKRVDLEEYSKQQKLELQTVELREQQKQQEVELEEQQEQQKQKLKEQSSLKQNCMQKIQQTTSKYQGLPQQTIISSFEQGQNLDISQIGTESLNTQTLKQTSLGQSKNNQ